jgi:hypothetical protein
MNKHTDFLYKLSCTVSLTDGRSMLDAIDRQIMEAERRLTMANESR